eukprot:scaffold12702_cov22-Tisochrysis_lutea.AAC.1
MPCEPACLPMGERGGSAAMLERQVDPMSPHRRRCSARESGPSRRRRPRRGRPPHPHPPRQ